MEKEFDKKVLLGDIYITEDEEAVLKEYMVRELCALDRKNDCNPDYPRVFAFGLVRFAMKWYSQRTFWPYFQEEYGESIKINNQIKYLSVSNNYEKTQELNYMLANQNQKELYISIEPGIYNISNFEMYILDNANIDNSIKNFDKLHVNPIRKEND
jgi:hypothetical protein